MTPALGDDTLAAWLAGLGLPALGGLGPADLRVEPAGDGNINWVRRVRARDGRSWIVKQARGALERFPEYAADPARALVEARWLALATAHDPDGVCPRVLHCDEQRHALVLEDVGPVDRLDAALARGEWPLAALATLGRFLGRVHRATSGLACSERLPNDDLQCLHGAHVFLLPFAPNDFPLPAPVRALAEAVWRDEALGAIARAAHARYREPRGALVHGDVQAGNVLLAAGPRLLDAEIAHVGDPALDPGMLLAHVLLPAAARGAAAGAAPAVAALWQAYRETGPAVELAAVARYAGIETIRRTIGAARVPVVADAPAAARALALGVRLARTPPADPAALLAALEAA